MTAKTEQTTAARKGEDVAIVTSRLLVLLLLKPSAGDAAVADAWCRLIADLGVPYDPRPNFDVALAGEQGES